MLTQTSCVLLFTRAHPLLGKSFSFLPALSLDLSVWHIWHRCCGIKADSLHEETAAGVQCVLHFLQGVNATKVIHKSYRWIIPFLFLTVSYPHP